MRTRWQKVSKYWEENKARANRLNLLKNLDYMGKLSSQLEWQTDHGDRPIRLVYTTSGQPTAAVIYDDEALVDCKLFWVSCKTQQEANFLLAVINSGALREAVKSLMSKGQFGARDLHKHLWKLRIPEFDASDALYAELAEAGRAASVGAAARLESLREERGGNVTVTIARRELRKWLAASDEGHAVEDGVRRLLGG